MSRSLKRDFRRIEKPQKIFENAYTELEFLPKWFSIFTEWLQLLYSAFRSQNIIFKHPLHILCKPLNWDCFPIRPRLLSDPNSHCPSNWNGSGFVGILVMTIGLTDRNGSYELGGPTVGRAMPSREVMVMTSIYRYSNDALVGTALGVYDTLKDTCRVSGVASLFVLLILLT